uniref:ILEI/PANDER domain-containing protein n=1 Tax=Eptatretus burgeri TaxID=7764 RepID=A0A8C4RBI1_EPTBU
MLNCVHRVYRIKVAETEMRPSRLLKGLLLTIAVVFFWKLLRKIEIYIFERDQEKDLPSSEAGLTVCNTQMPCPDKHFPFTVVSGAANVLGPTLCFNNHVIMSQALNNVENGLNIALIDGSTGNLLSTKSFNVVLGDVYELIRFIHATPDGTIVLIATFDDAATRLNKKARSMLKELGSAHVTSLAEKDSWAFVGAKGIEGVSPFEEVEISLLYTISMGARNMTSKNGLQV